MATSASHLQPIKAHPHNRDGKVNGIRVVRSLDTDTDTDTDTDRHRPPLHAHDRAHLRWRELADDAGELADDAVRAHPGDHHGRRHCRVTLVATLARTSACAEQCVLGAQVLKL